MAKKLNNPGLDNARRLVRDGKVDRERDDWTASKPSTDAENAFVEKSGWTEYAHWHLGADAEESRETKAAWSFPFGDFTVVHRSAVIACESRAAQNDYDDIRDAARSLLELIDGE